MLPNLTRRKFTAWSCRPSGAALSLPPPRSVLWRVRFEESGLSALRFPGNLDGPTQASLSIAAAPDSLQLALAIALVEVKRRRPAFACRGAEGTGACGRDWLPGESPREVWG